MKTDEVNYHSTCTYFHIFIKTLDIKLHQNFHTEYRDMWKLM